MYRLLYVLSLLFVKSACYQAGIFIIIIDIIIITITTTTVMNKLSILITSKWSWAPLELEERATTSPLAGFLIVTQRGIFEPDL